MKEKLKEILTVAYGVFGMIAFFAFLFYGSHIVEIFMDFWYLSIFLALPFVFIAWLFYRGK